MPAVQVSNEIHHRRDFAELCNARGLTRALEIGTDRGTFAANFMRRFKGLSLVCVDPYQPYHEMNWCRDADFHMAVLALAPYSDRVKLARTSSEAYHAATQPLQHARYPGYAYDFVYLDGDHSYEAVQRDIALWWDRISDWGILAGHDYGDDHPGVTRAVHEFADAHSRLIWLTQDNDGPASWYIYRSSATPSPLRYELEPPCLSSE